MGIWLLLALVPVVGMIAEDPRRRMVRVIGTMLLSGFVLAFGVALARPFGKGPLERERRMLMPPIVSLPAPGNLPESAGAVLQERMAHHGEDMVELMLAVTQLDHDAAQRTAERISSRHPRAGDLAGLDGALPQRFFALHERMHERIEAVSAAAVARDDLALGAAFGDLSQTCVSCHAVYMRSGPH